MKEYSNDGGRSWEGPFSEQEINTLTQCGVISSSTLVRNCGQSAQKTADAPEVVPPPAAPLPTAETDLYYVTQPGGQPQGPYERSQIARMLESGAFTPMCQVWKNGWAGWLPIMSLFPDPAGISDEAQGKDLGDLMADIVGAKAVKSFGIKSFFSEVGKHHTTGEMEAFFCAGGPYSTPSLVDVSVPKPWIYTRVLVFFIVLFLAFVLLSCFDSKTGGICSMVTVNFAVPFTMLVLFAEVNVCRDVSWFKLLQMLFIGGVCSLFFTFLISIYTGPCDLIWAGPVEETAKLAACLAIAGTRIRKGGVLQGLLCGAAIGAGFAIPESIQYFFLAKDSIVAAAAECGQKISEEEVEGAAWGAAWGTSFMRAFFAPAGHVLYSPIVAAAAWRMMDGVGFSFNILTSFKFIRLAAIGVLLHMFWNSPILVDSLILKAIIVMAVGWSVIFLLIHEGVARVKSRQAKL